MHEGVTEHRRDSIYFPRQTRNDKFGDIFLLMFSINLLYVVHHPYTFPLHSKKSPAHTPNAKLVAIQNFQPWDCMHGGREVARLTFLSDTYYHSLIILKRKPSILHALYHTKPLPLPTSVPLSVLQVSAIPYKILSDWEGFCLFLKLQDTGRVDKLETIHSIQSLSLVSYFTALFSRSELCH